MTVMLKKFKGRFGNQLLQYAMLRQIAAGADEPHQCCKWQGQEFFGLHDAPPRRNSVELGNDFPKRSAVYDVELFRKLFRPVSQYRGPADSAVRQMRHGATLVGVHCRGGDYGTFRRKSARWCFRTPLQWYVDWVETHLSDERDAVVVFVASDESIEFPDGPYTVESCVSRSADWKLIFDWHVLTQVDHLLISNSTFSFTAAMMNTTAKSFWRPSLKCGELVPFDPLDSDVVLKDSLYEPGCIGSADYMVC